MKACGIVAEYNPLHKGHLYHIQKTREITGCDVLIAVMSGNFVQRGEPAIIDKRRRTLAALQNGVDIVIELPIVYTLQSASHFASGAITLLDHMEVSDIVFGSESNNLEELQLIADMPIQVDNLKENLKTGMGFPKAYGLLSDNYMPNDILAIAYLKAIKDKPITPHSIQRTSEYHSTELRDEMASAKAIRTAFLEGKDVSSYSAMALDREHMITMAMYYPYLRVLLLTSSREELSKLFLVEEGIENHLIKQAETSATYEEFLNRATTRRYTRARIQRTLVSILLHIRKEDVRKLPPIDTAQLLGFNETGREYLKTLKEKEIRIASRFNQIPKPYRVMQYKSDVLYSMFFKDQNDFLREAIQGPIIQK